MRLLVDTHILIWTLEGSSQLSVKARDLLRDPMHEHWVSAASIWEIAIKSSIGKLALARPLRELEKGIVAAGFQILNITAQHAAAIMDINLPHNDPFDHLLLAQCEIETLRLMTADKTLTEHSSVIAV
ncbi:MAG TPA: type II toxin-antitoxin system VapC family toxin [Steroidobacteraceae bacterium]|nr:type II toxin-antitoxin system VapC family toxin [Steroidobacteraceae bacterium]